MLKKIISGGQTGAERAALDVSINLAIPHGGWIPRGRAAEDGILPDKYNLQESPTKNSIHCSEMNILDSDGTVIFTVGRLTGASKLTKDLAEKHNKPFLHVDLNKISSRYVVPIIRAWIVKYRVEILNVTGSRASRDQKIYSRVLQIIEVLYQTTRLGNQQITTGDKLVDDVHQKKHPITPKTVDEAVDRLIDELSLKFKLVISKMSEDDLGNLHFSLGLLIRNQYLYPRNQELLESCRSVAKDKYLHWDQAPTVIIQELWKRLKETHRLRVVK